MSYFELEKGKKVKIILNSKQHEIVSLYFGYDEVEGVVVHISAVSIMIRMTNNTAKNVLFTHIKEVWLLD